MAKTVYIKTALTGGASTALDGIDGDALLNGDFAHVTISNILYFYVLDATSGASESSPTVISPDANAGTKRWLLQNITGSTAQAYVLTKTDSYTITTSDFGKTIRMNAATAKIFTLPSVGSSNDGARLVLSKIGAGKVTVQTADTDKVGGSSAGGTIYCDVVVETYANLTLEYCDANTAWNIIGSDGTWVTT